MTSPRSFSYALPTRILVVLILAFLLSGMCALAYQVVWARMLSLVFGSTNQAISTVLAVFMLGLALGSHAGAKLSKRGRNLGIMYGWLEIALGCYALAFPFILSNAESVHAAIFSATYDSEISLALYRFLIALVLLIIPTSIMGATLPVLAQYIEKDAGKAGSRIGTLYAINTFGAALGSFSSAFLAIPYYGLNWTIYFAATLNVLIGLACIFLLRDTFIESTEKPLTTSKKQKKDETRKDRLDDAAMIPFAIPIFILFLIGTIGMLLENAWSHALVLVFGTSVYAFSTMLTAYLIGLSAGCYFAARYLLPYCSTRFLAGLLILDGFTILAITPVIGLLPAWFVTIFGDMQAQWHMVVAKEFLTCAALMFLPTFIGGATFPLCLHIITRSRQNRSVSTGVSTSIAYIWNTAGSICGALVAGFIIIPLVGSERCLIIAASLALGGAAVVILGTRPQTSYRKAFAGFIFLIALAAPVFFTTWDAAKMNSGVYVYSKFFDSESAMEREMKNYDLIFYKEGSASVAVLESALGHRFLRVNGKTDGSSEGDNTTQMLLGYLPYLYARNTTDALVIGLGTGITSACVLDLPVDSVESIEISPEVVEAASFFSALNDRVFNDPRSTIRILDGRTWLSSMPKKYDMIISEPSNPWQTGNANLFTADFFRIAGNKLNEGGILCQWIPYYNMDSSHFKLIIKSLQSVFPYVHLWMSGTDTFLLSSMQPLEINTERLSYLFDNSGISRKFEDMHIKTPGALLSFYYLDNNSLQTMTQGITSLNTDSFPVVEFHSPKFLLGPNRPDIFFDILEASYTSSLEISDSSLETNARILHRRNFYSHWRIPNRVTEEMLRRSLN